MNVSWVSPSWLWVLLLIPVYYLLALLVFAYRDRPFSSLLLWKEIPRSEADQRNTSPSITFWVSALLLSLLLAGIITTLAGPLTKQTASSKADVHFYVDLSASMGSNEPDGKTRYQIALDRLRTYAESTPAGSTWEVTLLSNPSRTRTGSPSEMLKFLSSHTPTDLSFQRSLRQQLPDAPAPETKTAYLITDTVSDRIDRLDSIDVLPVGTPQPNTGMTSLYGEETDNRLHLFLQLIHHGSSSETARLTVRDRENVVRTSKTITLPPNESISVPFSLEDPALFTTGSIRLEPEGPDALTPDNVLYFARIVPYRTRVRYRGPNNDHLKNLFASISSVETTDTNPHVTFLYQPSPEQTDALWSSPPEQQTIVVDPRLSDAMKKNLVSKQRIENVRPANHPITDGLTLSGIYFQNVHLSSTESFPGTITPLLTANNRVLSFLSGQRERTLWILGDPFLSNGGRSSTNWPISPDRYPSFIMFWQNVFEHFRPWRVQSYGDLVYWKTGESHRKHDRREDQNEENPVHTNQTGIHRDASQSPSLPVPTNLISKHETNTMLANEETRWESILPEPEETKRAINHTELFTKGLILFFFLSLISLSVLHRESHESSDSTFTDSSS